MLSRLKSASAALTFGIGICIGLAVVVFVVVVSRRDASRRNVWIPLSIASLLGTFVQLVCLGMVAVIAPMGG